MGDRRAYDGHSRCRSVRVCMGGTFDPFHVGHEALLSAASLDAKELFVGITDGALAKRARAVPPWRTRARRVEAFLRQAGYEGKLTTRALTDALGPAATDPFDRLVVSQGTLVGAQRIQAARRAAGLQELEVVAVPLVLGEDRLPVSATAIAEGRIERAGKRLCPIRVIVGSGNPVKVRAAVAEMQAFLGAAEFQAQPVASGVAQQPLGEATMQGAQNRAAACRRHHPGADYFIGIEAGLIAMPGDGPCDVQACVVLDRVGHATTGWGPGFHYPAWVTGRAEQGEMVSAILGPVADDPRIGSTIGAIGYLSEGHMDREALTRLAVCMALVPRRRAALYGSGSGLSS
jgi:inosine/xanthosine triphosphatase